MNVETVAVQFLFWEFLFQIFGIGSVQCGGNSNNRNTARSSMLILFPWIIFLFLCSGVPSIYEERCPFELLTGAQHIVYINIYFSHNSCIQKQELNILREPNRSTWQFIFGFPTFWADSRQGLSTECTKCSGHFLAYIQNAMATFWRIFHHEFKISPGWWGWVGGCLICRNGKSSIV